MQTTRIEKQTDKHVYANLNLYNNNPSDFIQCSLNQNFDDIVIQDPNNYHAFVTNFSVPTNFIPLFNMQEYLASGSTTNTVFQMQFTYGAETYSYTLVYTPTSGQTNVQGSQYFVFQFQTLLDMINVGFTNLQTQINAVHTGLVPNVPVLTLGSDQIFHLYAQKSVFGDTVGTPVNIWFSSALYDFFDTLPFKNYSTFGLELSVKDTSYGLSLNSVTINSVDYWEMSQVKSLLSKWISLRSIVITSNLPTRQEFQQTSDIYSLINSNTAELPILSNYIVDPDQNVVSSAIVFVPTAEFRLLDMTSTQPLRNINLSVFWQSKSGVLYPVYITSYDSFQIRIGFSKRV